jgi:hypothetical protein
MSFYAIVAFYNYEAELVNWATHFFSLKSPFSVEGEEKQGD